MTSEELKAEISRLGLAEFENEILTAALPCITFTTRLATNRPATRVSKVGGHPDLPPGTQWPTNSDGAPMLFLARIMGDDIRNLLPELAGLVLNFFGDWEYSMTGRVLAFPSVAQFEPAISPPRSDDVLPVMTECEVAFSESVSLPAWYDDIENWRYSERLRSFGAKPDDFWGTAYMRTPIMELHSAHYGAPTRELARPHQILGYPLYTQSHPAEGAEQRFTPHWTVSGGSKDAFLKAASRWKALLSLETDDTAELSFGDTGNCGFLITPEDLSIGNFDNVYFYQDNC